ncbi:M23 family metallopeptidase [Thalassotalea ponticola]|uniref:M23 family metallopeptidase n=1 Tax=Thalassotalea ponticola TaxID=1523392 RepID=UPI0025B325AD|nr:M23 family metallopeptidase [Thalassotalea ponticola]MDN3651507.1 M23 family metallopeptidase [Thalassotalea ponticola]
MHKSVIAKLVDSTKIIALCSLAISQSVSAEIDLRLEGDVTQGGLIVGQTDVGNQVSLNGKPLKVSSHGLFTFGFSRDDTATHELLIVGDNGEQLVKSLKPTPREYNIQRIEGIKKSIMQPSEAALKQIKQDGINIRNARGLVSDNIDFAHGFIAPASGPITGVYGSQRIYNGVPKNPHFGLDYAGAKGTPVKAPAAGVITLWEANMFYSGGTLVIDHGHGITSTFLHLSASYVEVGESVLQGQEIAEIGSTGRSTGPHLDWRVNWHNVRLDPALALKLPNFHTFGKKQQASN